MIMGEEGLKKMMAGEDERLCWGRKGLEEKMEGG